MAEKICVPQAACAGIDLGGKRYQAKNGVMTVDNPAHVRTMTKFMECFRPSKPLTGVAGFICDACGFATYFRVCGKCGSTCSRPGGDDGQD